MQAHDCVQHGSGGRGRDYDRSRTLETTSAFCKDYFGVLARGRLDGKDDLVVRQATKVIVRGLVQLALLVEPYCAHQSLESAPGICTAR